MSVSVKIEGADKLLAALRALPKEFQNRGGLAVRGAVRKAALLIKDEVVSNLDRVIAEPNVGGRDESTGTLRDNIKVSRGNRIKNGERYAVRVAKKSYPGQTQTTQEVARFLEYGTEDQTAKPFIRPAFEAKKEEAVALIIDDLERRVQNIWKKVR